MLDKKHKNVKTKVIRIYRKNATHQTTVGILIVDWREKFRMVLLKLSLSRTNDNKKSSCNARGNILTRASILKGSDFMPFFVKFYELEF